MSYFYQLSIETPDTKSIKKVEEIIGEESVSDEYWIITHQDEGDEELFFDYINYYLDLLEGKFDDLKDTGISSDDISIWIFYQCESRFDYEFDPAVLKRLGDYNISLCVSCFESVGHRASE